MNLIIEKIILSKITWITDNVSRGIIPEDHANFCRFEEEMNKKKGKRGIRSCKIFKIMYFKQLFFEPEWALSQ